MKHFIIDENNKKLLEENMQNFVSESEAKLAILIDSSGTIISKAGDHASMDTQSLAVLTAGNYASTLALAKLIGESEFFAGFHQGKRSSIHISLVGHGAILVGVFDISVTSGVIRLCAKDAARKLEPIIFDIISKSNK